MDIEHIYDLMRAGLRVHPLAERDKVPIVKLWQEKATATDFEQVKRWAAVNDTCNWGIATGAGSGVFVVDLDTKHGGLDSWAKLTKDHAVPKTWTVKTGSGGIHYYFKHPGPAVRIRNSIGAVGPGIDIRGDGGQVVVPPSIHPNGNEYAWVHGNDPQTPAEAPKWLLKLLVEADSKADYAPLGGEIDGGEKNNAIYHNALLMFRSGATIDFVKKTLQTWVDEQRGEGADTSEVSKTVESAWQAFTKDAEKRKRMGGATSRTDTDNADRLILEHKDDLLHIGGLGYVTWTGKKWGRDDEDLRVVEMGKQTMRNMRDEAVEILKVANDAKEAKEAASWATASLNAGRLHAMIDLARSVRSIQRDALQLDASYTDSVLNTNSGMVDLETGKQYPHDRKKLITRLAPVDYDPEAACPTWMQTLNLAFNGDEEMIGFMQRAFGYSLTGSTSEQCLFIAWGEKGANGKSTLLEGFQRIIGDYGSAADVMLITSRDNAQSRIQSSLAGLMGVRLVNMNEAAERSEFNESFIKQLTGGDMVEACFKYKQPFSFLPKFKMWLRTNEKPVIRSVSDAIWRRMVLIPFEVTIPPEQRIRRDVIDAAFTDEAPGILAWAVKGAIDWYKAGLRTPAKCLMAVNEYRTENDLAKLFIDECCTRGPRDTVSRSGLFQAFTGWAKENGYNVWGTTVEGFSRKVTKFIGEQERRKVHGEWVWTGLALSEESQLRYHS